MLRHEEARVEALDVLEGLPRVAGDGSLRHRRVGREEPGHRSVKGVAVEVVRWDVPLRQKDRGDRVAANGEKVVLEITTDSAGSLDEVSK